MSAAVHSERTYLLTDRVHGERWALRTAGDLDAPDHEATDVAGPLKECEVIAIRLDVQCWDGNRTGDPSWFAAHRDQFEVEPVP